MPAVIIAVVGLLVSNGFGLVGKVSPMVITAMFIFSMAFAVCLTVALGQNLIIQKKNRDEIKSIYWKTKRFNFFPIGSLFLFVLCVILCLCLILFTYKWLSEPLDYWKVKQMIGQTSC